MAKVKIEGNTLDLPDEIAKSNKSLLAALTPFYPAAANATIKREGKGDQMVVSVTKKAGTKGSGASREFHNAMTAARMPRRLRGSKLGLRKRKRLLIYSQWPPLLSDIVNRDRQRNLIDQSKFVGFGIYPRPLNAAEIETARLKGRRIGEESRVLIPVERR